MKTAQSIIFALTIGASVASINNESSGSNVSSLRGSVETNSNDAYRVFMKEERVLGSSKLIESSVSYSGTSTEYYHCGPPVDSSNTELVLLHGAAFTKEDWKTSGILKKFCDTNRNQESSLTVTALDLPVSATGVQLEMVFDALVEKGVLGGSPVVVVSPSASGKAIVTLLDNEDKVQKVLKGWIPVAPAQVSQTPDDKFDVLTDHSIPVLAIYGDQDSFGKQVTEKLVRVANAESVELKGTHPVYLDSPGRFVRNVLKFLEREQL